MKRGDIVHSALVIRVTGMEIELLEKAGPRLGMSTRTVDEVLTFFAKDEPYVKFLSPTLKGMTGAPHGHIGTIRPSRKVEYKSGAAAEDTHVLFNVGSTVTLPHEDRKLFAFIASVKAPADVNVHGYSSTDEVKSQDLAARRAMTVASALEAHLTGSKVEPFAHGKTKAFGSKEEARRVGIKLKGSNKR